MGARPELSIVVPAYNEESLLADFHAALTAVLVSAGCAFEVVYVDDGSRDATWRVIQSLGSRDPAVRGIRFSRNFGQQIALSAGLGAARGSAVICMDADLQHPPEHIPAMLEAWRKGAMIVNMVRTDNGAGTVKRLGTALFYSFVSRLSETRIEPSSPDFRLLDRAVVDAFCAIRERDRFVRGLFSWLGFPSVSLGFEAPEQDRRRRSRYTFAKMLRLALDAITSFTALPLRIAFFAGLLVSCGSVIYAAHALYVRFVVHTALPGWTSLMIVALFLGGCQMMFLGIIGEYLLRIFNEVKQRPLYVAQDLLNIADVEKTPRA